MRRCKSPKILRITRSNVRRAVISKNNKNNAMGRETKGKEMKCRFLHYGG